MVFLGLPRWVLLRRKVGRGRLGLPGWVLLRRKVPSVAKARKTAGGFCWPLDFGRRTGSERGKRALRAEHASGGGGAYLKLT